MTQITLNADAVAQLEQTRERAEVRDPAGRVIGYFEPLGGVTEAWDTEIPFTDEEIERFRAEPGGRPLEEILRDLEHRA
jgi:hypothetical protein